MECILIKGGRVIDPLNGIDKKLDIFIENERIAKTGTDLNIKHNKLIDAKNLIIVPGLIDMHVHLRDPGQTHKETIESGARAALKGGFTTIACMPNTTPVNDNVEITKYIISNAKKLDLLNILPIASVTLDLAGKEKTNIKELAKVGAIGFSDDGNTIVNAKIFRETLRMVKETNTILIEHPEEHQLTIDGIINEGKVSKELNLKGIPDIAEDIIVARDIIIQEKEMSNLHLTHLSTKGSYKIIKEAKRNGIKFTSDVTPHHLLLTEDKLLSKDSNFKVKPPLRTEDDRVAMIKGIQDGTIDCIATDHAPHTENEKNIGFERAAFGLTGLETSFSVLYEKLVRKNIISINRLIELMSSNPSKILKLKNRGQILEGYIADITIIDPEKDFYFSKDSFISKSKNSPFIGWKGKGMIEYTIVKGVIKFQNYNSL